MMVAQLVAAAGTVEGPQRVDCRPSPGPARATKVAPKAAAPRCPASAQLALTTVTLPVEQQALNGGRFAPHRLRLALIERVCG